MYYCLGHYTCTAGNIYGKAEAQLLLTGQCSCYILYFCIALKGRALQEFRKSGIFKNVRSSTSHKKNSVFTSFRPYVCTRIYDPTLPLMLSPVSL